MNEAAGDDSFFGTEEKRLLPKGETLLRNKKLSIWCKRNQRARYLGRRVLRETLAVRKLRHSPARQMLTQKAKRRDLYSKCGRHQS